MSERWSPQTTKSVRNENPSYPPREWWSQDHGSKSGLHFFLSWPRVQMHLEEVHSSGETKGPVFWQVGWKVWIPRREEISERSQGKENSKKQSYEVVYELWDSPLGYSCIDLILNSITKDWKPQRVNHCIDPTPATGWYTWWTKRHHKVGFENIKPQSTEGGSNFQTAGTSGKESACQCRRCERHEFDPWLWKIPWKRAWQPTATFLPGEFHGQGSLAGCSPCVPKESDTTKRLTLSLSTRLSDSKKLKRILFIWGFNQNLESSNTQISKIDGKITQHTKKQKMLTLKGKNNQQTPIPRWHI